MLHLQKQLRVRSKNTLAVITSFIKTWLMLLCLGVAVTMFMHDSIADPPLLNFITMYSAEILVIHGITATLLWLPWEECRYAQAENYEDAKCGDEENDARKREEIELHIETQI